VYPFGDYDSVSLQLRPRPRWHAGRHCRRAKTAPSEEQAVAAPINAAYARAVGDPRAVMNRLTAAQNAHDLEGMLACFHEDYHSEQPLFPARTFQGIDQVRAN
jgi:hypothetical protein